MQTLQVGNAKLSYMNHGRGEPLLFIHGIYASQRQWYRQIDHFSPDYQVITVDLRGHGESSATPETYSVRLFAADLVALLDHLGLERAVCCGHSFGGLVAQELALSYPDRVRGLILAETLYGMISTPWEAMTAYCLNYLGPQLYGVKGYVQLMAQYFGLFTPGGTEFILREAGRHLNDTANQQNILNASLTFDSRWRLHRINCPTTLVVAQYPHIPMVYLHNWEMYWRIPDAKLKFIPGAGHLLFWDNPADFNQTVADFMRELPPV